MIDWVELREALEIEWATLMDILTDGCVGISRLIRGELDGKKMG